MEPQITIPQWLALPVETRQDLKRIFNIPRSEGSHVQDNEVISDGHNHRDLANITVARMGAYTGSKETDFYKAFNEVLQKIEANKAPVVPPVVADESAEPIKKKGRPAKTN